MSASLETLRDDRVSPMGLEPPRFVHRCCCRENPGAAATNACEQFRRRQTELKTYDCRFELVQDLGNLDPERLSPGLRRNAACLDSILGKVRRQRSAPGRFALGTGFRLRMAEEVHVERLRGLRTDCGQLLPIASTSSMAHGSEPRPPALETATASALPCEPATEPE